MLCFHYSGLGSRSLLLQKVKTVPGITDLVLINPEKTFAVVTTSPVEGHKCIQ